MTEEPSVPNLRKGAGVFGYVKDAIVIGSVIAGVAIGWANMATKSDVQTIKEQIVPIRVDVAETKRDVYHLGEAVRAAAANSQQLNRIENNQTARRK